LAIHAEITGRASRRLGYYLVRDFFRYFGFGHTSMNAGVMVARGNWR